MGLLWSSSNRRPLCQISTAIYFIHVLCRLHFFRSTKSLSFHQQDRLIRCTIFCVDLNAYRNWLLDCLSTATKKWIDSRVYDKNRNTYSENNSHIDFWLIKYTALRLWGFIITNKFHEKWLHHSHYRRLRRSQRKNNVNASVFFRISVTSCKWYCIIKNHRFFVDRCLFFVFKWFLCVSLAFVTW